MHSGDINSEIIAAPILRPVPTFARTQWISTLPIQYVLESFRNLSFFPHIRGGSSEPLPTCHPTSPTGPSQKSPQASSRNRPRRLTLPLSATRFSSTYTNLQISSSFVTTLPLDVRYLIYDYVFHGRNNNENHSEKTIHIFTSRKGQFSKQQKLERGELAHSCASDDVLGAPVVFLPGRCAHHGRLGFLGMVLTCRIIYSEAILRLYSTATFLFFQPHLLMCFAMTTLPHRLDSVCSLRMEWERNFKEASKAEWEWIEAWKIICGMKALRQLRVSLQRREYESMDERRKVVEPMMGITGLTVFELLLPVEEDAHWEFLVDTPFTIVDRFSRSDRREIM